MMTFEIEGKPPAMADKFAQVEKGLRKLKSYGPHSFASLTHENGSYIQVAGGGQTCVIEKRSADGTHLRAYLETPRVPFEGEQTLVFGGGRITMQPNEILAIDGVIELFRVFFGKDDAPDWVHWRDMSAMFDNGA